MTTGAQDAVERMIAQRAPFEDIEQYIDQLALPSEQLSALWLLAWAEATDPVTRRQVVATALADHNDLPGASRGAAPGALSRDAPMGSGPVSARRLRGRPKRERRQRRGAK